ncbi:MFS transporter [Aspergillus clavatus NRRL 1]|uniref:MFS transporter, putative n=1 Tax=Aspergillus clavatus (strain ATCC 1007 / CBS 513.65 / DSM 816 / NCTC 3887 / NRRL 1 / QM 1276 / 107) TaxID=344612 RepID=A1CD38_ASPCL|nr:MFS transporter, putative [Aspergillus clavatus NRRL 1]EAW12445.1 MFS transporter, putative [Aspergillus clavatus NRRL 1]
MEQKMAESIDRQSSPTKSQKQDVQQPCPQTEEDHLVWWDGENDPANPLNWPPFIKWLHVAIISSGTFTIPLASSIVAPGVIQLANDFHTNDQLRETIVVSIFVLGLAFGPLLVAPLSELYGRWICYTVSNTLYTVFTIACAVSSNMSMLIVFRFFAGATGSTPLTIGGGTIADMFPVQERGLALSFFTLGQAAAPAIGPVAGGGGFLTQGLSWRWVFWLLTIVNGVIAAAQILLSRETYALTILERKAKRLRKETDNQLLRSKLDKGMTPRLLVHNFIRPSKMLLLSPITLLIALACAVMYGILYLLVTTFLSVFQTTYHFSIGISGLAYLGMGIGNILGLIVFSMTSDRYVVAQAARFGAAKPEHRLPLMILSGPIIAIGLFWYGWSARAKLHWIMPILGSGIVGLGNMFFFMPMVGYLVSDAFPVYAASAIAANAVLRSIGGALLPLAGFRMYDTLGYGWGNSVLAFMALVFTPLLIVIYWYGEYIRTRWPVNL